MPRTYKQMHFFKLRMYTTQVQANQADTQRFLNIEEKIDILGDLIENKLNNETIQVLENLANPFDSPRAVIEILSNTDGYTFGKIGSERDINAFQLRNLESMASTPIPRNLNEVFEAFSYFYIDKATFCVGYLHETSAPSVGYLGKVFTNEYREERNVFGQLDSLFIEDALPLLRRSAVIGSIEYRVVLPANGNMPVEMTGLSEEDYENLTNQKETVITVMLKAQRRKESVFPDSNSLTNFFTGLSNRIPGIGKVKVKAKEEINSLSQTYTLSDNPFTRRVDFNYGNGLRTAADVQNAIEIRMRTEFNSNREAITDYMNH